MCVRVCVRACVCVCVCVRAQIRWYIACVPVDHRYGEIVNINLVRDKKSGKSKGFCFLAYQDQRSTVLAVDNFNGIKVCRQRE